MKTVLKFTFIGGQKWDIVKQTIPDSRIYSKYVKNYRNFCEIFTLPIENNYQYWIYWHQKCKYCILNALKIIAFLHVYIFFEKMVFFKIINRPKIASVLILFQRYGISKFQKPNKLVSTSFAILYSACSLSLIIRHFFCINVLNRSDLSWRIYYMSCLEVGLPFLYQMCDVWDFWRNVLNIGVYFKHL